MHPLASHCLSVTPQHVTEPEGEPEVYFYCRESSNVYAIDITWQDPLGNIYSPGSAVGERVSAEDSFILIVNTIRNDSGVYRCQRQSNPSEFAEGRLTVYGKSCIVFSFCSCSFVAKC